MKTQKQLIEIYEARLKKTIAFHGAKSESNWKGTPYVEHAEKSLEEVKAGRPW